MPRSVARATKKLKTAGSTGYPHIVKVKGVGGTDVVVEGTRMGVAHIVGYYYKAGLSIEDILRDFPHLSPSEVFSALAYYHDHQAEIDRIRYENSYEFWKHTNGRGTVSAEAVSQ